ncbi:MAG: aldehyde dehydrogenase family protein [Saprospiraceae bacterium]|nr:aldehyde dehydrogenase family protein [Saprospiraceae bacterium]
MSEPSPTPPHSVLQEAEMRRVFELQQQHQYVVARTSARQRIAKLRRLHDTMLRFRREIEAAVWQDLRKSPTGTNISEVGVVNSEIRHAIRHLRSWTRPKRVGTPLVLLGTSSKIVHEPKGVCLVLSPWNFPFNLTLSPIVSAVAAGNCVVVKPSEYTPASTAVMRDILAACFPPEEVALFEGGAEVAQALLRLPFNHVFFTGSPAVGKIVMREASNHLASVTLELGGKNPTIVDETADIDKAADKIAWLKGMNAGQSCIAPDYVLAHENIHDRLVETVAAKLKQFYGDTAEARQASPDLCRIVHERHFARLKTLLDDAIQRGARVAFGGKTDAATRYVEPTVLTHVPEEAAIWQEETFGPILLVRPYQVLEETIAYINARPRPLAMYLWSSSRQHIQYILAETRNGDVTINDCGAHFYNPNLPFGGINNSGIGKTHGEFGFLEFSNARGILRQNRILPITSFFMPPYRKHNRLVKWMLEGVVRWF